MKCKNCKAENIMIADFCKACGHQFTEKEKKKAYNKTAFGVIDNILKIKSYISFDFITGNKLFKVLSLLVLVLYSFMVLKINGNQMRILDSKDYEIEYNKTTKEYYLLTDENEIGLELYIPPKMDVIKLIVTDENNAVINKKEYGTDENVILSYTGSNHYIIQSDKQQMEIYVIME